MDFLDADTIAQRRRILSVWLARLPTDRLRRKRHTAAPSDTPLAIAAKIDSALQIYAVDPNAAKLGLFVGQPLANARAMVPHLAVVEADPAADAKLLEQIADWSDRFSPYVALDPPDGLLIDVSGVAHLFEGEAQMMAAVHIAIARQGFAVHVGMAGTAAAAWALSHFASNTIAEPGCEASILAPLAVEALACSAAIHRALRSAGLKTVGQVAARGRAELTSRFGKAFVHALERTLGKSDKPISPRRPVPDFLVEHRFADPVVAEAVIVATLNDLAMRLTSLLEEYGLGARALDAAFFRADGVVRRIAIETGAATRDPAIINRLFAMKLDSLGDPLDPGFGFDLIRLEATRTEVSAQDMAAFGEDAGAARAIQHLIDRLSARYGAHRVLRFQAQDSHIPEAAAVALPAQSGVSSAVAWQRQAGPTDMPRRPLRLFAYPEPISVVAEIPDGPPLRFRWRSVLHTAAHAAGPESIAMEWWRQQAPMPVRDYFRVEDEAGRRFWLFREGIYGQDDATPRWFIHGMFA